MYKEYSLIGEQVYSEKLPNGLSVFIIPKRGFHKRCAYFAANYGAADRRFKRGGEWIDDPMGLAHFLEHKMFDTQHGSALTKLSENGASANAFTSSDVTAYHFECVDKFSENLETLLSFVSTPYFTPEGVEKERGIIGQEILMDEDDPDHCLYYGLMRSLLNRHPLRDPIAGTVESIAEITAKMLYDRHGDYYSPSNMVLCAAGDIDPSEVSGIAQKILPQEPREVFKCDYGEPEDSLPEAARFSKKMEVSLPIFLAGCKTGPAARGRDSLKLDLVGAMALELLAGHSSPLYIRLYGQGLVNSDFSASFDSTAGVAYTIFGGEAREPDRVFGEVVDEIIKLSETGPDEKLFARIKKAAVGGYLRSLNSFDSICGSIVGSFFRGYDAFDTPDILSGITEGEVAAFWRERLRPENMAVSIVEP